MFKKRNILYVFIALVAVSIMMWCSSCRRNAKSPFEHPVKYYFKNHNVQALCNAISRSDMDEMKEIIDSKTTNINFAGTEGVTPLMWAMKAGNKKAFLKLLKSGANPNSATGKGKYGSVIFYALRFEKDPYYLETALKNGGNPNLVYDDTTPMYYAMDFDDDITKLKMLVAAGADVNSCGEGQDIPIVVACGLNQYDAVLFLLENGADYSKKNMFNNDLRYALKENLTNPYFAPYGEMLENLIKVVDFLEKKGVDVKEFRELIEKRRKK